MKATGCYAPWYYCFTYLSKNQYQKGRNLPWYCQKNIYIFTTWCKQEDSSMIFHQKAKYLTTIVFTSTRTSNLSHQTARKILAAALTNTIFANVIKPFVFSSPFFFFITHSCILEFLDLVFLDLVFLQPHVLKTILAHWRALSILSELSQWQHVQKWKCQQHSEDLIAILNWHSELEDQYQKSSDDRHQMNGSWTLGNSKPVHIWDPYCQYHAGQNLPNHYCPQQNRWMKWYLEKRHFAVHNRNQQSCEKPKTCTH